MCMKLSSFPLLFFLFFFIRDPAHGCKAILGRAAMHGVFQRLFKQIGTNCHWSVDYFPGKNPEQTPICSDSIMSCTMME
jgi:hypothetical protein